MYSTAPADWVTWGWELSRTLKLIHNSGRRVLSHLYYRLIIFHVNEMVRSFYYLFPETNLWKTCSDICYGCAGWRASCSPCCNLHKSSKRSCLQRSLQGDPSPYQSLQCSYRQYDTRQHDQQAWSYLFAGDSVFSAQLEVGCVNLNLVCRFLFQFKYLFATWKFDLILQNRFFKELFLFYLKKKKKKKKIKFLRSDFLMMGGY